MRVSSRSCALAASVALAGLACGRPEAKPYSISTASLLPESQVGASYSVPLSVDGGVPPFAWSLRDVPPELQWLSIDAATGMLSGTPSAQVEPGAPLTVAVTDAYDVSVTKPFTLAVRSCVEGQATSCYFVRDSACMVGQSTCAGGKPAACVYVDASSSVQHCGGACDTCDSDVADNCAAGLCQCGTQPACSGATPTCCPETGGAACVDTQNGNTAHCGSCGPCPTFTSAELSARNMTGVACQGGTCTALCAQPSEFKQCGALQDGCTDTYRDPKNCGACGVVCASGFCCQGSCNRAC